MNKAILKLSAVVVLALVVVGMTSAVKAPASRSSSQVTYNVYHNARFGYKVSVPSSFKWEPEAENSDGRYFRLNKNNYFCAYGMHNVDGSTLRQKFNSEKKSNMKLARMKDNWYVLSYKDSKGFIHYTKVVAYNGGECYGYLEFVYEESYRSYMNPIVTRVARDFNGKGWSPM